MPSVNADHVAVNFSRYAALDRGTSRPSRRAGVRSGGGCDPVLRELRAEQVSGRAYLSWLEQRLGRELCVAARRLAEFPWSIEEAVDE